MCVSLSPDPTYLPLTWPNYDDDYDDDDDKHKKKQLPAWLPKARHGVRERERVRLVAVSKWRPLSGPATAQEIRVRVSQGLHGPQLRNGDARVGHHHAVPGLYPGRGHMLLCADL